MHANALLLAVMDLFSAVLAAPAAIERRSIPTKPDMSYTKGVLCTKTDPDYMGQYYGIAVKMILDWMNQKYGTTYKVSMYGLSL
ncbi:hypothetical protein HDU96_000084 [Phlyctochytrium bullatum]|nr:hypothetical protein HDU96_000084 [Phlyctochytrium bullatum]